MNLYDYERDHLARIRSGLGGCMVLLRRNGAFPLSGPCTLALYGSGARHCVFGGTGSGAVNSRFTVGVEQALTEAGFRISSGDWLDRYAAVRAAVRGSGPLTGRKADSRQKPGSRRPPVR